MDKDKIRLKIAHSLGDTWEELSPKGKDNVVNIYIKNYLNPELEKVQQTLSLVTSQRENYGLFFLGIFLGIFGGLVAIILDRDFFHFGLFYQIPVVFVFFGIILFLEKSFNEKVLKKFKSNEALNYLLDYAYKNNVKVSSLIKGAEFLDKN